LAGSLSAALGLLVMSLLLLGAGPPGTSPPTRMSRSPAGGAATPGLSQQAQAHVPIQLLDAAGRPVDTGTADPEPYSPRMTCGGCHSYDTISQGYHFQLGADSIADDYGAKTGKPWILSDGMMGRQFHMSYKSLAKKSNSAQSEIATTPYQFAQTCGKCHPGGGLMERDRDGERYDLRQQAHPELAASLDGDYHNAAWDRSGVLEIDCLLCHQSNYHAEARLSQLTQGNLKWAATAGAGLGVVKGAVNSGDSPTLSYRTHLFHNGKVELDIADPADRNCLFCHAEAEVKKRGHVWDGRNDDVHTAAGLQCVSCHTAGLDHQMLKGRSNEVMVRNDLDSAAQSCESCHTQGRLGAAKPAHKTLPATHLERIACVTCHVRDANVTAVLAVDTTTGSTMSIATAKQARKFGESVTWRPAYFRLDDGKLYAGNALLPVWWGNRTARVIHPLLLRETRHAYEKVKHVIADDSGDGKVEANKESQIKAMLAALRDSLQGGRFKQLTPVYVKGHTVYELKQGLLTAAPHRQASPLRWTFSHNVSPARKALGAGGCTDCHGPDSTFFTGPVVTDPYGEHGQRVTLPMWRYLGLEPEAIKGST